MKAEELSKRQHILTMLGVMLGVLLSALDSTIVGTSMPKIIKDLRGMEYYAWPFTAYMLISTISIPIFGKLANLFGQKKIYITGLVVFMAASMLCGLSKNMVFLIVFRGLQGLGGGILVANAFGIVAEIYTLQERGKYMGILGSMFGISSIIGPGIGGFITDSLGWHWIFYVNMPVGLFSILAIISGLPGAVEHTEKRPVDWPGIITLTAGLAPLLLALSWGGSQYSWVSLNIIGLFITSILFISLFVVAEKRAREPIFPLFLFEKPVFTLTSLAAFFSNGAFFCGILFLPLYLQEVRGASASASGLAIMPMTLAFVIGSVAGGQIVSGMGKYKILSLAGLLISALGLVILAYLPEKPGFWIISGSMIIMGLGLGINIPIFNIAVQNSFSPKYIGLLTSAVQFFRNVGGAAGAAILGTLLAIGITAGTQKMDWGKIPVERRAQISSTHFFTNPMLVKEVRENLPEIAKPEFDSVIQRLIGILGSSVKRNFLAGAFFCIAAFILVLFTKEMPFQTKRNG